MLLKDNDGSHHPGSWEGLADAQVLSWQVENTWNAFNFCSIVPTRHWIRWRSWHAILYAQRWRFINHPQSTAASCFLYSLSTMSPSGKLDTSHRSCNNNMTRSSATRRCIRPRFDSESRYSASLSEHSPHICCNILANFISYLFSINWSHWRRGSFCVFPLPWLATNCDGKSGECTRAKFYNCCSFCRVIIVSAKFVVSSGWELFASSLN